MNTMKNEKFKKFLASRGAKSLMILLVVVLVGVAVYVNYKAFYDPTGSIGYGSGNMDSVGGDSAATGGTPSDGENYFTATALNRQQSRDEAIDVLKLVSESAEASAEARAEAAEKLSQIAVDIQNEANIETLIKAKGYSECVAVISDGSVSVIVAAEELKAAEAAQIFSIVYETTGIDPECISIINK